MSSLGERIKYAREQKGYLQSDLAKLIGVKSSGVISNWEKDLNKPDAEKIVRLCNVLDVSASFLLDYYGKSSFEFTSLEEEHIKKYRALDEYGKDLIDTVLSKEHERIIQLRQASAPTSPAATVPIRLIQYYQRLASAGSVQIVFDGVPVEQIEIPDRPEYRRVSYAVGVNGHSMEPLYEDGDILLIEPTCQVEQGEVGIFIVGNNAFVKKLGETELISVNKDYKNIPLTEDTKCMGRVVDKLSLQ